MQNYEYPTIMVSRSEIQKLVDISKKKQIVTSEKDHFRIKYNFNEIKFLCRIRNGVKPTFKTNTKVMKIIKYFWKQLLFTFFYI